MSNLDDLFARHEAERRAEMAEQDRIDALPENAARIAAKRKAEFDREVAAGLRTPDGDWIDQPEAEDDEDDEDEAAS